MRATCVMFLLTLLTGETFGQTTTSLNLATQGRNADFSSFPLTRPISVGSALPTTCALGQLFFNSAAAPGANVFGCNQLNAWTVIGGYALQPAGANTLGGVIVQNNSGLVVGSNGALSANVGTGQGSLAAGNDSRIVNALQASSLIPAGNVTGLARSATIDTTNASNISTGTFSSALFPGAISSSTTGNAATATALAATPGGCSANQYAQGISANGTTRCAQVAYSQVSGTPALYDQMLQVGGVAQTQRTNLNFAAGPNVTITPADNGTSTTTLTLSAIGGVSSVAASKPLSSSGGTSPTISCATCATGSTSFANNALIIGQGSQALTALSATGSTTQVLHGNASGSPSWAAVNLASDVIGKLPSASVNGLTASATTDTTNASNISSGTLNAGRLPNPTTLTLGGVESFAAPAHQWISSISTAGIPASAQPAFGDIAGSLGATQVPALTGDTTAGAGSTVTTTARVNGTSVPVNSSADQTMITTAPSTASWTSVPGCLDSAGNHLNYNTATHAFSCGNTGGTAGSAAFGSLSGGTNTQAAMLVGAGSSLAPTGSGTITANTYSGTVPATSLPTPTVSTLGGIQSYTSPSHQWINAISTAGVASSSQPGASDVTGLAASATTDTTNASNISSGTLNAARLPNPTALTLGGIESFAAAPHQWINSISTAGFPASAQPAFGDIAGSLAAAQAPALTGDTAASAGSTVTTTSRVNGTSVPVNSSADQTIVTTGAATGSWASVPSCLDSGGNHLNYNTVTHTFLCGNTGGTAGSAAFNSLSSGTNTQAAMLVGSGSSLAPTGSGTITANTYSGTLPAASLPAPTISTLGGIRSYTAPSHQWMNAISTAGIPSGSQPAASDVTGLAASATTDTTNASNISSGTLNAARLPNPTALTLGGVESFAAAPHQWINSISTAGLPASIQPVFGDIAGSLGATQVPALTGDTTASAGSTVTTTAKVNGTSVPVNSSADQTIITTGVATGSWTSVPGCLDSGGNHLNYNTVTHTLSCGNTGAGSAFGSLSGGTNSQAAMLVGAGSSLAPTGSGTITANAYSGTLAAASLPMPTVSTLGGIQSYNAPSHQWINTISTAGIPNSTQPSFNDITGTLGAAQLPAFTGDTTASAGSTVTTTARVNGTSVPVNSSADQTMITTAQAIGSWVSVPSCLDSGGNHLNYNTATHTFSCGNTGGTAGSAAFGSLSSGTNTAAAMFVGTGASLAPAASGTINANLLNGTRVPTNSSGDQVLLTTASVTGAWVSLPNCMDSSGNHLNYNTSTHSFSCGSTSSGGGGSVTGGACAAGQYTSAISTAGVPTCSTPAGSVASIFTQSGTNIGRVGTSGAPASLRISGPSPWVDVKAYGAVGNAVTNDAAAIQAAINAAGTGTIFFPCGIYYIGTGLTQTNRAFRMTGAGSTSNLSADSFCAQIVSDQPIVLLTLGSGATNLMGGTIEHLAFRDTSTASAGYVSGACPSFDAPCGGNGVGGILVSGSSFTQLSDLELDGFSGASEYAIKLDGGSIYQNHNSLRDIVANLCHLCVVITGLSDGPDMDRMLLTPSSPVNGVSGNIGIDCQADCSGVHLRHGKCTISDTTGICAKIAGADNEFDWQLESYSPTAGSSTVQNTGFELLSGASRNLITASATRFTNVVLLDAGSSRTVVTAMGTNNTNLIVNHSTSGNNLLINGTTGTIGQAQ